LVSLNIILSWNIFLFHQCQENIPVMKCHFLKYDAFKKVKQYFKQRSKKKHNNIVKCAFFCWFVCIFSEVRYSRVLSKNSLFGFIWLLVI